MLPQFEAKMAFANITGGIGFEPRGMPLPCFDGPAFAQRREKWCRRLIDRRIQVVHVRNGYAGTTSKQIAVRVNVKMRSLPERLDADIAAEFFGWMPP